MSAIVMRPDRGVVEVSGEEAESFLERIVTATVTALAPGRASFGALLTPQGKILFDFFLLRRDGGFLIEIARPLVADLLKRLSFYRLRARVVLADRSSELAVAHAFGPGLALPEDVIAFEDPRLSGLAIHVIAPPATMPAPTATLGDWHAHRIGLGVPESGLDFPLGDTFPHDADMDDLHGVDFAKGCFIGQEVVSRMKHRGTARRRVILARALEARPAWPDPGTEITCADKILGTLGSADGTSALALVRLDRAREAIDLGDAIEVGGVTVALDLPAFASFGWG